MKAFLAGVAFLLAIALFGVTAAAVLYLLRLTPGYPWGPAAIVAILTFAGGFGFIFVGAAVLGRPIDDPPA